MRRQRARLSRAVHHVHALRRFLRAQPLGNLAEAEVLEVVEPEQLAASGLEAVEEPADLGLGILEEKLLVGVRLRIDDGLGELGRRAELAQPIDAAPVGNPPKIVPSLFMENRDASRLFEMKHWFVATN